MAVAGLAGPESLRSLALPVPLPLPLQLDLALEVSWDQLWYHYPHPHTDAAPAPDPAAMLRWGKAGQGGRHCCPLWALCPGAAVLARTVLIICAALTAIAVVVLVVRQVTAVHSAPSHAHADFEQRGQRLPVSLQLSTESQFPAGRLAAGLGFHTQNFSHLTPTSTEGLPAGKHKLGTRPTISRMPRSEAEAGLSPAETEAETQTQTPCITSTENSFATRQEPTETPESPTDSDDSVSSVSSVSSAEAGAPEPSTVSSASVATPPQPASTGSEAETLAPAPALPAKADASSSSNGSATDAVVENAGPVMHPDDATSGHEQAEANHETPTEPSPENLPVTEVEIRSVDDQASHSGGTGSPATSTPDTSKPDEQNSRPAHGRRGSQPGAPHASYHHHHKGNRQWSPFEGQPILLSGNRPIRNQHPKQQAYAMNRFPDAPAPALAPQVWAYQPMMSLAGPPQPQAFSPVRYTSASQPVYVNQDWGPHVPGSAPAWAWVPQPSPVIEHSPVRHPGSLRQSWTTTSHSQPHPQVHPGQRPGAPGPQPDPSQQQQHTLNVGFGLWYSPQGAGAPGHGTGGVPTAAPPLGLSVPVICPSCPTLSPSGLSGAQNMQRHF